MKKSTTNFQNQLVQNFSNQRVHKFKRSRFQVRKKAFEEIVPESPEGELLTLMASSNRTSENFHLKFKIMETYFPVVLLIIMK